MENWLDIYGILKYIDFLLNTGAGMQGRHCSKASLCLLSFLPRWVTDPLSLLRISHEQSCGKIKVVTFNSEPCIMWIAQDSQYWQIWAVACLCLVRNTVRHRYAWAQDPAAYLRQWGFFLDELWLTTTGGKINGWKKISFTFAKNDSLQLWNFAKQQNTTSLLLWR
jgi:hypothetical protein